MFAAVEHRRSRPERPARRIADVDASGVSARLVRVVDGDTVVVRLEDGAVERVRLLRVNTPERDQLGYAEATAALRRMLL